MVGGGRSSPISMDWPKQLCYLNIKEQCKFISTPFLKLGIRWGGYCQFAQTARQVSNCWYYFDLLIIVNNLVYQMIYDIRLFFFEQFCYICKGSISTTKHDWYYLSPINGQEDINTP